MGRRGWLLGASTFALVAALCAAPVVFSTPAGAAAAPATTSTTTTPAATTFGPGFTVHHGPKGELDVNACATPVAGHESCLARIRIDQVARSHKPLHKGETAPTATIGDNGAYSPPYLQSAYQLPSTTNGTGETVGIVDAFDDPNAESDLGVYRSMWGLSACTTANGCFSKVNQNGSSSPLPSANGGWAVEISLDIDMVSAICPNCHILLVEANSNANSNLAAAAQEAYALGADAISNSYGGGEGSGETTYDADYDHPGVPETASAGDSGYGTEYPATSPGVVAVGGTTLNQLTQTGTRNATETAWSGTGSGCSTIETKQTWQHDPSCTKRMETDVSAVADPNTPVWVYDTYPDNTNHGAVYDWVGVGGTSAASPIIASVFALTGITPGDGLQASSFPYAESQDLYDITSGSNGSCAFAYYCNAGVGYDGPTGLGTPNGLGAFEPTAPAVTAVSPSTGSSSGGTSVTITGTGFNGATAVHFASAAATSVIVVSPTQITANSPAGVGVVDVTVTTPAGGTSATSGADQFTYVAPLPTVSSLSPAAGPLGGTAVTITGTNFSGATAVTFGTVAASTFTVKSATQITTTAPAASAGTVDVTVTTAAGISASSPADHFTYTTAPTVTVVSPAAGPLGGTAVTITGTNFSGATSVSFGAVAASTFTVKSATQITATAPAESAGTVNVTVTTPGGTSATSSADQFTYVAAPTVTGVSPSSGPLGGTPITITGTGFTGASAVTFGSTPATTFSVVSSTQITTTAPAGPVGTVNVTVTTPGGTSATSSADQFTYVAAPTVTAVAPPSGPLGGTAVTITGTNFSGTTTVTFGSVAANTFTIKSATQITTTAPAESAGTVNVTVSTPGGTSATSSADQFTYVAAPTVTAVAPSSGPLAGTPVTITGTNLSGATAVTFGSTAASTYNVISGIEITATAPAGSAGTVNVTVSTPGGTSATSSADQFTYVAAPTVTGVNPSSGPLGGTPVTITGINLSGATAVTFGSTAASTYSVISGTQITATAPPESAGTVNVIVTTAGGNSASSSADDFSYLPVPTVTAVSPVSGPTTGGTPVTVTGSGFTGATTVEFGPTPVSFTVVSSTSITVTSPGGGAGPVDLTVATPGGVSGTSPADQFTYVAAPTVSSVAPPSGPLGGVAVTITGTNLLGASGVTFGSTGASTFTVVSATQINATAPAASAGTVDVTVTTPGGVSVISSGDQFTYVVAPTVTSVSPPSGPNVSDTSLTIAGTGFTGASTVFFGSTPAVTFTVNSSTSLSAVAPAEPTGIVDVTVTTSGGTSATSANDEFSYFAVLLTSVLPNQGPVAGGTTVTITGTDLGGATAVDFGSSTALSFTVNSSTSVTATSPAGTGTVNVTVTTPIGVIGGGSSTQFTYVPQPTVTAITPNGGPTSGGTAVTVTGTSFTASATVDFGSLAASSVTVVSATQISAVSPARASTTVNVTVTTPSGTSPISSADQFTYSGPYVTKVSPTTVSVAGGGVVTITGSGFVGATAVHIGASPASSFTFVSSRDLTAVVPPEAVGTYDVTVSNANGSSPVVAADHLTYLAPAVTHLSPAFGAANRSTVVTLTGVLLGGVTAVHFGSLPAVSFTVHSATSVSATAPPQAAGTAGVTVTTPAGVSVVTSADQFTYKAPTVSKVTPTSGTVAGGTPVLISGTLFSGVTSVTFGGTAATSYTVISASTINAVTPPGVAGTVDIVVTAAAGTTAVVAADHYTYVVPAVTKVAPTSGPVAGGTGVIITGVSLHGATAVTFGGMAATTFTVTSATSISAVAPAGAAGTVDIRVTTSAGQTAPTSADHFTYIA